MVYDVALLSLLFNMSRIWPTNVVSYASI